jgi:copper chaperone NosL
MFKILCVLILTLCAAAAAVSAAGTADAPRGCLRCGMDRGVFARSRAVVNYSDGSSAATCSIHCAVEDMKKSGEKPVALLQVADYRSGALIDAQKAVWVVGGKKSGVMTAPAKWAFASALDVQKFIAENGGAVTPFQQVLQAVREEVDEMARVPELE